ncbi:MAG: diguanylate cyclase [Lachnospiraceae bacterium]|nr:diguanylate cyclase [Lachnospiraceae bacterium]
MKEKKNSTSSRRSIRMILISIAVVPVVLLGVILTISNLRNLRMSMEVKTSDSLDIAANSLYNTYSMISPGDYEMKGDILYKGDLRLTGNFEVVDALKESYKLDLSLYYGDTRILTTILDENGSRAIGSRASEEVKHWVLKSNKEYFSKNVVIGSRRYYGFYVPMLNRDGSVVGMAFAGIPASAVSRSWNAGMVKSIIISVVALLITLLLCLTLNRQITNALTAIQKYLGGLASGNFDMKMPINVRNRQDEIGDMGRYAIEVCNELELKITTDPLTGLLNRRACNAKLQKILDHCNKDETARATVCIGDIDFFKRVNDTYGHECGDIVLKKVSEILKKEMNGEGIVARWGGEEFLVVFPMHVDDVIPKLNEILWKIRSFKFNYDGYDPFNVTMTFGVNGRVWDMSMDEVIKEADRCLYDGKETGRNRIVVFDGRVVLSDGTVTTMKQETEQETEKIKQAMQS